MENPAYLPLGGEFISQPIIASINYDKETEQDFNKRRWWMVVRGR